MMAEAIVSNLTMAAPSWAADPYATSEAER